MNKLTIGVLFGGRSGEHEVSVNSAKSVISYLDRSKFNVIPIGIKKDGSWISGDYTLTELEEGREQEDNYPVTLLPQPTMKGLWRLDNMTKVSDIDVIFPVLHGTFGEDGTIQGLLELAELPYIGASVLGSSLGMDKLMMKEILRYYGLTVANYVGFSRSDWQHEQTRLISKIENELNFPMFVKPANLGSSVGISKVKEKDKLISAVDFALKYSMKCLVEDNISGKELEVSVLGNEEPRASVCGEVIPANEFYDYQAKYVDDNTRLVIPAKISQELDNRLREISIKAVRAIDVIGLSRVDFFVTEDTEKIYVNEINTMPGFTSMSMYPKLWQKEGVSYQELLTKLVELALSHYKEKTKNAIDFREKEE